VIHYLSLEQFSGKLRIQYDAIITASLCEVNPVKIFEYLDRQPATAAEPGLQANDGQWLPVSVTG